MRLNNLMTKDSKVIVGVKPPLSSTLRAGCALLTLMTALVPFVAATAQEASSDAEGATIGEIVVTAQKRSESSQKIPVAIAAFTGADLTARGVSNVAELAKIAPGLVITGSTGFGQVYLRGIGTDAIDINNENAVAVYVDGVYQSAPTAGQQEFNDVERVEILKGPQGTLYGRNTTGGAINVITREPGNQPSFNADLSYGNHNAIVGKAYASIGNEKIAASLAGFLSVRDGVVRNLNLDKDVADKDIKGLRGKIRFNFDDNWKVILAGSLSRRHDSNAWAYSNYGPPIAAIFGGRFTLRDPKRVYANRDIENVLTTRSASATIRGSVGGVDIVSITSLEKTKYSDGTDVDGTDLDFLELGGKQQYKQSNKTWSQELQILSNGQSPLKWIAGLYTSGVKTRIYGPFFVGGADIAAQFADGSQNANTYAAFGQATYDISPNVSLTLGGRYTAEKRKSLGTDLVFNGTTFLPGTAASKRWKNFSPKATIEYHDDSSLIYATYSQGFKSGTFNIVSQDQPPVDPEKMRAYELGGKHSLFDRTVRFNWAAFYYDYKNLQVTTLPPGQALTVFVNAGKAEIYGAEFDAEIAPTSRLRVRFSGTWLHGRYNNFKDALVYRPDIVTGAGYLNSSEDVSGNTTIRAPKFTGALDVSYTFPINSGKLKISSSLYFNSGYFLDPGNTVRQPNYATVDSRVEYTTDGGFTLYAFGKNLSDKQILSGIVQTNAAALVYYSDPRTYGIGLGYRF